MPYDVTPALLILFLFFLALTLSWFFNVSFIKFESIKVLNRYLTILSKISGDTERHIHRGAIPRIGGIAIFLSASLSILIFKPSLFFNPLYFASAFIFALGICDDFLNLSAKLRLFLQLAVALLLSIFCGLTLRHLNLGFGVEFLIPTWLGHIVSMLIIVGAINSFNMIDGLDGLAGGIAVLALIFLSYAQFVFYGDTSLCYLAAPAIGGVLGFLQYNTYPARIFMGDAGSNWLGFLIGICVIFCLSGYSFDPDSNIITLVNDERIDLMVVALLVAFPVFDTLFVLLIRLLRKQNPMRPDNRHYHHRLLRLGFSQSQSVTFMLFITACCAIAGLAPHIFFKYDLSFIPPLAVVALTLLLLFTAVFNNQDYRVSFRTWEKLNHSVMFENRLVHVLLQGTEALCRYQIYLIFFAVPLLAGRINLEMGYASLICLIFLVLTKFSTIEKSRLFFDLGLYLSVIVLLIINNLNPVKIHLNNQIIFAQAYYNYLFYGLFFASLILFLSNIKRFILSVSSSDCLLLFLPLVLVIIPEPYQGQLRLQIIAIRSLIVFFALQLLLKRNNTIYVRLRFLFIISLILVSLISLLGMRVIYVR